MNNGKLYLIPVPLGATPMIDSLPTPVIDRARTLAYFVAENAKTARAFLKALPTDRPLQQIDIKELNEHTPHHALHGLLAPALSGHDMGLVSEAGCPVVADPGAALVALAHESGIQICPMIGPSSILLALMGSGLCGQNFAFHGYLPAQEDLRRRKIVELEKDSRRLQRTQLFIETPYRNARMLRTLIDNCAENTRICIATDLTLPDESITTHCVREWKRRGMPAIDKRPTLFLLQA